MDKIRRIVILIVSIVLLSSLFCNCYAAAVPVTKENLEESLLKFMSSDLNKKNYEITVTDNIITIEVDEKSYNLSYDITEKPTFSMEIPIEQGMSYVDFKEQTDNLMLPMLGYIAVADIQNVEFEDSMAYFLITYLANAFDDSQSSENSYVIIDDTNLPDGVTIDREDEKTIYASEFGERVMEYVVATYKEKQTIQDLSEGIGSYEWITERKETTDTSCKLVSTLSVNLDADFSKLIGYSEQLGESFLNKDITKENADYAINLKVGQKCSIETTEKITGHELNGKGYEYKEINENCAEIIGKSVGEANGYIYVGETKKSFFITIEENTENTSLDTINLKINTKSEADKTGESDKKQEETNTNSNNNNNNNKLTDITTSKTILPKTGVSNVICIVFFFSLVLIIIFSIKLKKYKGIK